MKKLLIPFLFLLSSCSVNKYLSLECKDYDTEEKILTLNVDLEGDKVEAIFPNQNGKTIFVKGEKYFNFYDPEIDDFPKSEKLPEKGFINIKLMDYQNKDEPKGTNYIWVTVDETKENWHFFQRYMLNKYDPKHPNFDIEKYKEISEICSSSYCEYQGSLDKLLDGEIIQTGKCSRDNYTVISGHSKLEIFNY